MRYSLLNYKHLTFSVVLKETQWNIICHENCGQFIMN
jgi:hypothetical protein